MVSEYGGPLTIKLDIEALRPCVYRTNGVPAKSANPKLEVSCDAWMSQKKDTFGTNVCGLYVSRAFPTKVSKYPYQDPTKYQTL